MSVKATITRLDGGAAFDLFVVDSMGRIVAADQLRTIEAAESAVAALGLDSFTYYHEASA